MAAPGGVVFNFIAKTADATRDIAKLDGALEGLGKGVKGAGRGIGTVLSGVGKAVPVVGAAVVSAAAGFTVMAKAAYDDANAQAKLERSLRRTEGVTKKAAHATDGWVDQMRMATLVSKDDLRQGLGELTKATGSLSKAQKLSMLAWDVAVGTGKEYGEVLEAMTEAAGGNAGALQEQAQWLKVGKDGTLTFKSAVEQLTGAYGGAAKAAADKDVFGRIGAAFELIGQAIGEAALPLLQDLSEWFADSANIGKMEGWIEDLKTWARDLGEDVLDKVKEFIDWLKSPEGQAAFDKFKSNLDTIAGAAQTAVDVLQTLKDLWDWYTGANNQGRAEDPRDFFTPEGGGTAGVPRPGWQHNAAAAGYNGGGTTINIYNPKPERASTSVASGLRVSRPNTVSI